MKPVDFPESTTTIARPSDLEASQCQDIRGFIGPVEGGSLDGITQIVVAWQLSREDIVRLLESGGVVYLSFFGGIPAHRLDFSFADARNVA